MCWRFDVVTAVLVVSSSTSAVGFKYAGLRHWTGIFYKLRLPAKREEAIRCLGKFEGGGTLVDERGLVVPFDTDLETGRNYTFTPHFEFQRMRIVREIADVKRRAAERKMRRKHKRENHLPEHLWESYVRSPSPMETVVEELAGVGNATVAPVSQTSCEEEARLRATEIMNI
eukprot:CAMPEP_0175836146 /NCGR_PEP_ID=MMETSP0107_2-20121207/16984_1 /TAXON_ID=195067 ORGANISM="Goniomonas pacifica, Strain CCMP1869" /NCGR_SAMPLE_ID=MMETSP0107_2 /ASSEMBLY_ACC=CAM_ASM_000203 /LENGTH=171 /DNA_ID=CAMNT_0017149515 /DNA_START=511 /DNA_END=1026 /DNA_ORIENTATION=-